MTQVQSNADALSDVVRTLSANVAVLKGYIDGGDQIDSDTANPAPLSPGQSLPGHDHSGGWFGRPFHVCLATFNTGDNDFNNSFFSGQNNAGSFGFISVAANESQTVQWPGVFPLWVPGCDPGRAGAYSRLAASVIAGATFESGTQSNDEIEIRLYNRTSGDKITLTKTGGLASTIWSLWTSSDDERLRMVPGRVNHVAMAVEFIASSTTATRQLTLAVDKVSFGTYDT